MASHERPSEERPLRAPIPGARALYYSQRKRKKKNVTHHVIVQNDVEAVVCQKLGDPQESPSGRLGVDILVADARRPRDVGRCRQGRRHGARREVDARRDHAGTHPVWINNATRRPHDRLRRLGKLQERKGQAHGVDSEQLHPPHDGSKVGDEGVARVCPEAVDHRHAVFESKIIDAGEQGVGLVERGKEKKSEISIFLFASAGLKKKRLEWVFFLIS